MGLSDGLRRFETAKHVAVLKPRFPTTTDRPYPKVGTHTLEKRTEPSDAEGFSHIVTEYRHLHADAFSPRGPSHVPNSSSASWIYRRKAMGSRKGKIHARARLLRSPEQVCGHPRRAQFSVLSACTSTRSGIRYVTAPSRWRYWPTSCASLDAVAGSLRASSTPSAPGMMSSSTRTNC